jgi:hypothetical protein
LASRSTIKSWIRTLLAASADDPAWSDAVLDPIVQQAADSLVADIHRANPAVLYREATLAPNSSTSHSYTFATQPTPITDFAGWIEVRWTDSEGLPLDECRLDELRAAGGDYFTLTGLDEATVLVTSPDSSAGKPIWLRYRYWPARLVDDNSVPGGISAYYHDVIALEALFAFGLGGEQQRPPELQQRWFDRRGQLFASVGRRGNQVSRTRVYTDVYE